MLKKSKKNQDEYKLNLNKRRKVRQNWTNLDNIETF